MIGGVAGGESKGKNKERASHGDGFTHHVHVQNEQPEMGGVLMMG